MSYSKAFLFLLSARACGLGIDLPSISAIIILDSDWNAKADVQALSRAHLLGPPAGAGAPMRLLRLFMRNSVEEKILALAERKGGVAAAFRPGSAGGYAPIFVQFNTGNYKQQRTAFRSWWVCGQPTLQRGSKVTHSSFPETKSPTIRRSKTCVIGEERHVRTRHVKGSHARGCLDENVDHMLSRGQCLQWQEWCVCERALAAGGDPALGHSASVQPPSGTHPAATGPRPSGSADA